MTERSVSSTGVVLPRPPATVHLVGVGGIGMSGLAQYLCARGYRVGGSDRQLDGPGRGVLIRQLRELGISVHAQDGSGVRALSPDVLVASSAVEDGNPDLVAGDGRPLLGRARALAQLLDRESATQVAIGGSCGKTSVTAWVASALRHMGHRVLTVCGGYVREFEGERSPGNFSADPDPAFAVVEVDESDRTLVEFSPDCGVVLNVGTDHYSRDELLEVFGGFLSRCRSSAVLGCTLAGELTVPGGIERVFFGDGAGVTCPDGPCVMVSSCSETPRGVTFSTACGVHCRTAQFGRHSVWNACAVLGVFRALGLSPGSAEAVGAIEAFGGVRQRFEWVGRTASGCPVYCDYAHNVEKIASAVATARGATGGPVLAVFQPHGYGPLRFMKDALTERLRTVLRAGDRFLLLPVYYAGGTTSFSPTSAEVAAAMRGAGIRATALGGGAGLRQHISDAGHAAACVLVMGARDPGLPSLARGLTVPDGSCNESG